MTELQVPVWLTVTIPPGTDPAKVQQVMEPYLLDTLEIPHPEDDMPFTITNLEVGVARLIPDA